MILLQGQGLARHFGPDVLFENISLEVQERSRIALVGRNGTGKSTLLKILAGIEEPSLGMVSKKKDLSIGYLDQYASVDSENTIWEEMIELFKGVEALKKEALLIADKLGNPDVLANESLYQQTLTRYDDLQEQLNKMNAYGYEGEIRSVLHGFQFYPEDYDKPIQQLSGGQRTRLALAKILLEKHDLLILDEPTNHLDIETLTWLEDYLKSSPISLLIVSHDQYFLDKVCQEVYEIHHHTCEYYKGNYSYYVTERENRFLLQQKAYEKQQEKIQKLEEFVAKNIVRASTTKRAQSRRKQLEKMERIEKPQSDSRSARFSFSVQKESGNQVLNVQDAIIGYDGQALAGPIGKSTLLKSLIHEIPWIAGESSLGANVQVGYYDQNLSGLNSKTTVLEELWSRHTTMPEKDIRTILGSFLFSGKDVEKSTAQLSGGEKARLALAKLSLEHDNFLLLDEPTNHLDIDSKEVLEYDGTICFVSHDRYFINQVATSILEITPEGSTLYLGDYDYYIEKKQELEALKQEEATPVVQAEVALTDTKKNYLSSKEEQKQLRTLTRQVEQLEEKLHQIEQEISSVHEELTLEEVYTNPTRSSELQQTLQNLNESLEEVMIEWEEASLALEEFQA